MKSRKTFSEYFKLNKTQYDLDFFDCYIYYDTPLFIDPWAIRCGEDDFSVSCYQKICSVFDRLIDYTNQKDKARAIDLLDNLHEPRETGLGYAKNGKEGSSIGREKSEKIYDALLKSKAVRSGQLIDLEDTALHIEGIGRDNVSDIVTNIIRYDLIKYTQEQCDLYNVRMTMTQTKIFWDEEEKDFIQKNEERLLLVDGKKVLLVPKRVIRKGLAINYSDFYNKTILEFEQGRHYDARTSLCRMLRDKKNKKLTILKPPYKKTLKEDGRYNLSRDLVFKYIDEYPKLLEEYKKGKIDNNIITVSNNEILEKQNKSKTLRESIEKKIKRFEELKPGEGDANNYHDHILDCLNIIFNDSIYANYLSAPKKEAPINQGRKKIDIKYHNSSVRGFFSRLSNYGNLFCAKILFECKNYTQDLKNPEYDQLVGRFNNRESTIGFIVCRNISNKNYALEKCRDFLKDGRGYVFILTDIDIIKLLQFIIDKKRDGLIDNFLELKMKELSQI